MRFGRSRRPIAVPAVIADDVATAPFPVSGAFNGAIRALRRGRQQHKLAIRKLLRCHAGISSVDDGVSRPHHLSPALAIKPAGQDPGRANGPQVCSRSDALSAPESQSFLQKCCCWFAAYQSMK
jgi:hypothetical protein